MIKNIKSDLKKIENGNVEILFSIPADLILNEKPKVLLELGKNMTIAGFRKGMAPVSKIEEAVDDKEVIEHILNHILPQAWLNACQKHKIKPAAYPKFEAVKITSSKNLAQNGFWEIKAITCELPKFIIPKNLKTKLSKSKNENEFIEKLIAIVNPKIPEILISEEVNLRLSQVLQRIEKLGLTLEGYLQSVGKDISKLREEYKNQAINSISLELILNKIAREQRIKIAETEIDDFIKTTGEKVEKADKEKREMLKRILMRKRALDFLKSSDIIGSK